MTQTYILVDYNNIIVNSCIWDGDSNTWQPPAGLRAFLYDGVWRDGWIWDGTKAIDPNAKLDDLNAEPDEPAKAMNVI